MIAWLGLVGDKGAIVATSDVRQEGVGFNVGMREGVAVLGAREREDISV